MLFCMRGKGAQAGPALNEPLLADKHPLELLKLAGLAETPAGATALPSDKNRSVRSVDPQVRGTISSSQPRQTRWATMNRLSG